MKRFFRIRLSGPWGYPVGSYGRSGIYDLKVDPVTFDLCLHKPDGSLFDEDELTLLRLKGYRFDMSDQLSTFDCE